MWSAMEVKSINIGQPANLVFEGKTFKTAIFKRPVSRAVYLTKGGFIGDAQANRRVHGGPDKAVCAYSLDHYSYWNNRLDLDLGPGTFGENVTLLGFLETRVNIGDIFEMGKAVVQVSQPRQPCENLSRKIGVLNFSNWLIDQGFTGCYFRVLREGSVETDDLMKVISRDLGRCTVDFANRLMYHDRKDQTGIQKLLEIEALSFAWRKIFLERLCRKNHSLEEC